MTFAASQTKGSGILRFRQGTSETIVLVKHITKICTFTEHNSTSVEIHTVGLKYPTNFKIASTEKKGLIDFLISEQNLIKAKSLTKRILSAAGLI
jgi:hypothetical protein